jgi:hypothetical protein
LVAKLWQRLVKLLAFGGREERVMWCVRNIIFIL